MAATKSKSSTSSRKSTAKGSTKTPDVPRTHVGEKIDELRDKRAAMDQPVVDTPVAPDTSGETQTLDDNKDTLEVIGQGTTITISIGSKSVTLDREGALSLQRHLDQASAGL